MLWTGHTALQVSEGTCIIYIPDISLCADTISSRMISTSVCRDYDLVTTRRAGGLSAKTIIVLAQHYDCSINSCRSTFYSEFSYIILCKWMIITNQDPNGMVYTSNVTIKGTVLNVMWHHIHIVVDKQLIKFKYTYRLHEQSNARCLNKH